MQEAHFQNVVDARAQFGQVEGFADEILSAGFESAQFVRRLRRNHEDRKITVLFDFLEAFHHLKSVHAGHLQIEQDQAVAALAMTLADLVRIGGGFDGSVAGDAQHALQQKDVGFLIVHDQDSGVQNAGRVDHGFRPDLQASCRANSSATSRVSRNSGTLIGFVR